MCVPLTKLSRAIATVGALLLAGGCGQEGTDAEIVKAKPGKVAADPQRPGDPRAGRDAFLNRAVMTCGIPYSAYLASAGPPDPKRMIPGRTGRNAELPYSLTAYTTPGGVELVTANCLSCHAAVLNGEVVIGLGNEFLDFTGDPLVAVEGAGAYV